MPFTNIQLRRDTASNWTANNPVLLLGETGWETDTLKTKLGNGTTAWNSLLYDAGSALPAALASATLGQGASLVTYLAPYTGAVATNIQAREQQWVSVLDFGAVPNSSAAAAANTVAIQNALNNSGFLPVYFPTGTWFVTGTGTACLTHTNNVNIFGSGARFATIEGDTHVGASTVILDVALTNAGNNFAGTVRNFSMHDIGIASQTGGTALLIDCLSSGTVSVYSSVFERLNLTTGETTGGFAFVAQGGGFQFNTIQECTIEGGIYLNGTADGNRIIKNNCITAINWNISISIPFGAYETIIALNTTNGGSGSIHVIEGSQVKILYNQIEQGSNAITVTPFSQVWIAGTSGQPCLDCTIEGNNFGGGTNVGTCLWIDYATNTRIRNNVFSGSGTAPTSQEINFTANASYNYVYSDNVSYRTATVNNTRFKLLVADSGVGEFGVPQITGSSSSGGYSAGMTYFKDPDTEEVVLGSSGGGATASGTVIVTLPVGFKPAGTYILPAATAAGPFTIATDPSGGNVTCNTAAPSNASVGFGVRFPAKRGA